MIFDCVDNFVAVLLDDRENAKHTQCCTDAAKETRKVLIEWKSYEHKIIKGSVKQKGRWLQWILSVLCTTNHSNEDDNDNFYGMLQLTVEKWPGKEMIILIYI